MPKGSDRKVPVRRESRTKRHATILRRYPHAIIGTHQHAHTTKPKVDAHGDTCVFKDTGETVEEEQLLSKKKMRQKN